ncbi:competence type IV pilus assembly protein ComGB [Caenibacillus caldisaponilyticus]|uniref:competence type IV pilus assembly protein ComGB n=1 Tax=Caenibacillus caldisaponilyticus TaxID=1674942 RepID=UPI0009887432|nr:competence type IV pilus assembly protein ComGB [Caenibacillus caldisaponilyticus]
MSPLQAMRCQLVITMPLRRKWKKVQQADFLTRVGTCLDKGYSLADAIRLQHYEQPPAVKKTLLNLLEQLSKGDEMAHAFQRAGFPNDVCSFLHFASHTGELPRGFLESGRFLKVREQQKEKMNKLMRYPLFLLWIFAIMVYVVLDQLLPSFEQLYSAMDIQSSPGVRFLLYVSRHSRAIYGSLLITAAILILFAVVYAKKIPPERRMAQLLYIPILSSYLRLYLTYTFSFHIGGLLRVGLSVNDALKLMEAQPFDRFFKSEARALRQLLNDGHAFSDIIAQSRFYARDLPAVIRNGDVSGRLGETLFDYSEMMIRTFEEKTTRALSLVQPVFFVLFGGLIIGLFLSILTPMFTILNGL